MSRERRILEAAAEAFHDKGFHGVGVDELGERAGLSGPTLYRHFAGKQEILATLLNEAMDELSGAAALTSDDPEGDLLRAIRHHVQFALRNRSLVTLYQREVGSLVDPWAAAFHGRRSHYVRRWEGLVRARFVELDLDEVPGVTQACLSVVFSVASWPARALAVADVEGLVVDLACRGLYGHAATD